MHKTIFITGGASGIGRAVAVKFGQQGWFVGIADINEAGARETAAMLPAGKNSVHKLDVRDREAWEHGCGFAGSGFVDVGNPDEPALLAELDRNRAPDARSAAGNEDRLVHPLNPPIVPYIAVSRAYRAGLL
jgi:NAD(P)-dependent dehydrogenase (short-subunit alcohol dehydrogenase family)